jgi:hypothetical protein
VLPTCYLGAYHYGAGGVAFFSGSIAKIGLWGTTPLSAAEVAAKVALM